jgi:hypothetical protein
MFKKQHSYVIHWFLWTIQYGVFVAQGTVWHRMIKQAYRCHLYKVLKQVEQLSTYSISSGVLTVCFLEFNFMPRCSSRQPTICFLEIFVTQLLVKSLWLTFQHWVTDMHNLSDYDTEWLIEGPHSVWILAFVLLGWDVSHFPSCNTHSSCSFSCCCILHISRLQLLLLAGHDWC